jgi:1-acyl-sn-glycerol-3-phosphate acyltransferase
MGSTFLYDQLVRFLWLVTRVFFRQVEVVGLEHVSPVGAVVFCGNHPNSLIDPVLITTSCDRRVRFAAKDVLFESRLLRVFLKILGAVPIKRRMDHKGDAGPLDNTSAFDALFEVLRQGAAFGIFPEGISHSRSDLAPLKTGAARIALGAAEEGQRVTVVPCGLTYHRRERMRGRVLVQFGQPIEVTDERRAAWKADPKQAARELTEEIELGLRALTINAPDFETLRVLDGCRRLYRPPGKKLSLAERAEISRRFIDHWERLKELPELKALFDDIAVYLFQLEALGLTDKDLLKPPSRGAAVMRMLRHLALIFVAVPLALPGVVVHLPVILTAIFAGEALTSRKDVRATTKMITATGLTLLSYLLIGVGVLFVVKLPAYLWVAPLVFFGLLLSGWATIRVLERQAVLRRGLGVLFTLVNLKREVERLQGERERLRARLLETVDRFIDPELERVVAAEEQTNPRGEAAD